MQIVIFGTPQAKVILDEKEIPYVNATIMLTPNKESDKVQIGMFTYLDNKPVPCNVMAIIDEIPVDSETNLDLLEATCCDLMCMKIASMGYEIELKLPQAVPSKKETGDARNAV